MPPPSSDSSPAPLSRPARFVRGASLVSFLVGAVVFIDWVSGLNRVRSLVVGTTTMRSNTALLFMCAGAALWLAASTRDRRAIRVLAAVVVAVAAATLFEYAADIDIGLDQLLASDPAPVPAVAPPGRMGINTAVGFVITRQLLAFSRKQILRPRVLDVSALILDLERMLRRIVFEHVQIVTRLAPDVGRIRADPTQIEQVLVNLVVNARDAMPKGARSRSRPRIPCSTATSRSANRSFPDLTFCCR